MAVAYELAALFIPEPEREGFEACEQCDGLHGLKQRFRLVTLLQVIVWNPGAQVVDVMIADVA